jgi:hypothetical protein
LKEQSSVTAEFAVLQIAHSQNLEQAVMMLIHVMVMKHAMELEFAQQECQLTALRITFQQ